MALNELFAQMQLRQLVAPTVIASLIQTASTGALARYIQMLGRATKQLIRALLYELHAQIVE